LTTRLHRQLQALADPGARRLLGQIRRGIEKENLRIDADGRLAKTPHPACLGSALTHASITTDYSEALLEFITPASTALGDTLRQLEEIHTFVYGQLGEELLWTASMPCIVSGDEGIPVARYGSSNLGRMKTIYRYGLGHRYGRVMQAIAGIHYNFSMPAAFWEREWRAAARPGALGDYVSARYLGLIRNFRRYSWLLIYLYGASPAVCASFVRGRQGHGLQPFDEGSRSYYLPYGTALRMGDLGYNSSAQKNLNICYNSLENYLETLRAAILTPHPAYRHIPCGQDGEYQQLRASLLQIENEFYSPIRPKRVARPGETALTALRRGGIEYVEVRCVDVSPFSPLGIDAAQIRFLDTFLLYCLLQESPPCGGREQALLAANLEAVVNRGRQPGLTLQSCAGTRPLAEWGGALLGEMQGIAELQDAEAGGGEYAATLGEQMAKLRDPELTPSARILREMREQDQAFFHLAMGYSRRWAEQFRTRALAPALQAAFEAEAQRSIAAQRAMEQANEIGFEQYLRSYFAQYEAL
jgi:glutamate--cysteine ligase